MGYEFIKPSMEMSKLVIRYSIIKNNEDNSSLNYYIIPNGFVCMVFCLGKNSWLKVNGTVIVQDYFILSSENKNKNIVIESPSEIFIVTCRSAVFYAIFEMDVLEYSKKLYSFPDIFDGYPIAKTFKEIKHKRERISFFENFILNNTSLRNFKNHIQVDSYSDITFTENPISIR